MQKHRHTLIWGGLVVVVAAALFLNVFGGEDEAAAREFVAVERGSLQQLVRVTGHAEPLDRAVLAFPIGGRVTEILVDEGTHVERDTLLASIGAAQLVAAQQEAQARLTREQAVYDDLASPVRREEVAVREAAVLTAHQAFDRSVEQAGVVLARAFVYADDALHEEVNELFDRSSDAPRFGITFSYGTTDYVIRADAQTSVQLSELRAEAAVRLDAVKGRLEGATEDVGAALVASAADLAFIEQFCTELAQVVNRYVPTDTGAQTVYESFQTSVASARTAVATARSEVQSAYGTYDAAQAAIRSAERDLDLIRAGASDGALRTQQAAVQVAEAAIGAVSARFTDTRLVAPIAGVITRVDPVVGETVRGFDPVVEIMTEGAFEVVSYVPEVDIAEVSLRDKARITFDAFGRNAAFSGEVIRIALTETVREGVPTYKTTIVLTDVPASAAELRPGMTADVDIMTEIHTDALYIPAASVEWGEGYPYVYVWDESDIQKQEVTTGIRSYDGSIEIIAGLTEGQQVVK